MYFLTPLPPYPSPAKTTSGEFALPPKCTELTIVLEFKFSDAEQATTSMKLVSEYELPEEERRFYRFTWDERTLVFPEWGQKARPWKFTEAPLFGFNFSGVSLQRADLTGSAIAFCDLSGCDLTMATLRNANLSQANLTNTNFQHTRCEGAVFNGCKVGNAIFEGTYMTGAKSCEKMKGEIGWWRESSCEASNRKGGATWSDR